MIKTKTYLNQCQMRNMNNLESLRKSPVYWHKRQTLNELRKQKPMFAQLMQQTRQCMTSHPELANDVTGAIQCETIHPQTLSPFANFTFHTHPHNIPYPSDKDKETTTRLNKEYLLIGLAQRNQVYVYRKDDNFEKVVARF